MYHHLPSGTVNSAAQIILGPGAVLNVDELLTEIADFAVEVDRLSIDPNAMIISEDDISLEIKDVGKTISSTMRGVGRATGRKITDRGKKSTQLARDITALRPYLKNSGEVLDEAFRLGKRVLLEGTQGSGLSLHHGPYPYVTSRDTTVAGCLAEAGISPSRVRKVVMVCRSYPIRVSGPSGPFSQELSWETIAKRTKLPIESFTSHEITTKTKRPRRVGEFEWTWLRKSASLNAPTDIALTFADYLERKNCDARRFEQLGTETIRFIEEIERVAAAPVSLISTRFHSRAIIDRRSW